MEETQVRVAEILIAEEVQFELDTLEKFVAAAYPDIRKIINSLQQQSSKGGVLTFASTSGTSDVSERVVELLSSGDFSELRKFATSSVSKEEFDSVYQIMYQTLNLVPKFKNRDAYESAIVLTAGYLYKHALVAIPELNFEALCIELSQI
jgi:DNA polymerase III delta prime subunit